VNDAVDQNGWTLLGSITTDGKTDVPLNSADILGYDLTFTQGATVDTLSGSGALEITGVGAIGNSLEAFGTLILGGADLGIEWGKNGGSQSQYFGIQAGYTIWDAAPPAGFPSGLSAWTIASVPEPSSLVMGGLAALTASAYGWSRRRAARSRAAAAA
jgi:hypothetical protein